LEVIDKSAQYTAADGMIDVKKLIAAYSFEEHAERADKYFDAVTDPWAHHLRKPFTKSKAAQLRRNNRECSSEDSTPGLGDRGC
jgi:hypothetical protein